MVWGREFGKLHSIMLADNRPKIADAALTDLGKKQAYELQRALRDEMKAGLPVPHRHYCSPLKRAINTCEIMFEGVAYNKSSHPVLIMEVSCSVCMCTGTLCEG